MEISEKKIENLEKLLNIKIKKIDFDIESIDKKYIAEAKKLLPNNNYIGFSITQGNEYRKKSWKLENFISLAKNVEKNNKIPVFFIKKESEEIVKQIKSKVPNSLFPEHNSDIADPALVTALSSRLEKAVSIDNGVMHMMALANIPMIVLFGPTNSSKFAPKNKFTKILDSKKTHNSKDINSIEVDEVLSLI